jgi:PAS domain S-box-containing protein
MKKPLRVLLLEDTEDDALLAVRELRRAGFEPDWRRVETEPDYLAHLEPTLSVILADYHLPQFDALKALHCLQEGGLDIPFIVVTGALGDEGAVECLRQGATDYLLKDRLARLGQAVAHALDQKRVRDDQRRAVEALARSEERYRSFVTASGQVVWTTNAVGEVDSEIPEWQAYTGQTAEQARGLGWMAAIHPEDRARVTEAWRKAYDSRRLYEVEYRLRLHDGTWRQIWARGVPVLEPDGHIREFIGTCIDITERKRAEEALRQERDFAESLIETAQVIVVVLDPACRIIRTNPYLEELSGYQRDEIRGKDWFTIFVPERKRARRREVFARTIAGTTTRNFVNPIVTKSGRERTIAWASKALKDATGSTIGVLATGHDITELRAAQQRALQAERLAAIGEMVTGLAHESRNALHRSQVCLEMLALEIEDRPEALRLSARIQQAQDDLHILFEDVRNYAAPIHLERRVCDLAEIWRTAWAHLVPLREGQEAVLQEKIEGLDLHGTVDPYRLEQVFLNILGNALAACGDAAVVEIRVARAELDGHPALSIAVHDNGPGLDPEQRQKIFEPFYTTKTKGTGLGMSITKRIVEAHGGRIAVGEGAGPGAEIILTLPRGSL